MKILGIVAVVMGAAALSAGVSAGSAGAVDRTPNAFPSNCSYAKWTDQSTRATCGRLNGGAYRAVAGCKNAETGKTVHRYGLWVSGPNPKGWSTAWCQGLERVAYAGIDSKS